MVLEREKFPIFQLYSNVWQPYDKAENAESFLPLSFIKFSMNPTIQ